MEMLKMIFCFLLRDYERDEGFQSLRTRDSNFSSSMGHTMLRNETVSNKIWGWNITSGFQNFIPFIVSKECCILVNHCSPRVLDSYLQYIICVFLCMYVSLWDFSESRDGEGEMFLICKVEWPSNEQSATQKSLAVCVSYFLPNILLMRLLNH